MELYHLKIYIDDLLHRAVGPTITGIQLQCLPQSKIFLILLSKQLLFIIISFQFIL